MDLWSTDFVQRAALALFLLAPLCASLGTQVVGMRLAFYTEAIGHSAFTGIALGLLLGLDPQWTLVSFALFTGLAITLIRRHSGLAADSAIGVCLSAAVAAGLAMISLKKGLVATLFPFLFGDLFAIDARQLLAAGVLFAAVWLYLAANYNKLLLMSISERMARASGVNVAGQEIGFNLLLALVVAFSVRAVGILLVSALLLIPAAAARLISRRGRSYFWLSNLFGLAAAAGGFTLSLSSDLPAGAAIILCAFGCFLLAGLWRLSRG